MGAEAHRLPARPQHRADGRGQAVLPRLHRFLERRATGDTAVHHVLDRPRNAATRTGLGAAGITCYGVLWAAAGTSGKSLARLFAGGELPPREAEDHRPVSRR